MQHSRVGATDGAGRGRRDESQNNLSRLRGRKAGFVRPVQLKLGVFSPNKSCLFTTEMDLLNLEMAIIGSL